MLDELKLFKDHVSIVDIALNSFGFLIDKKKSCKSSVVLRSGAEKLVVMKHPTFGYDTYFGRVPEDRGTVIDFVNFRLHSNDARLIPVRQLLRQYAPGSKKPAVRKVSAQEIQAMAPVVVEKDLEGIAEYLNSIPDYTGTYLTETRGLDQSIIERFSVGLGMYGNAIFPHITNDNEYCGYEYKNKPKCGDKKSVTGFSEGGHKGFFVGCPDESDIVKKIVVTEAGIDALSYYQLKPEPHTLYISTAGTQLSELQKSQLMEILYNYPNATLVLAMDNDEFKDGVFIPFDQRPGEIMAKLVTRLAHLGMKIVRDTPILKDWNADLLAKRDQA